MMDMASKWGRRGVLALILLATLGLAVAVVHLVGAVDLNEWVMIKVKDATIMDLLWVVFIHVLISSVWRDK